LARRSRAEVLEELRLFAEHHLVDIRRSRKGREIVAVKHSVFGWISPTQYYALQHSHELLGILEKVVEGGYRLKAALWTMQISPVQILGSDIEIPVAGAIVAGAIGLSVLDAAAGNQILAIIDLAALVLPFGEIYLLLRGAFAFTESVDVIQQAQSLVSLGQAQSFLDQLGNLRGFFDAIRRLLPF